MARPSEGTRSAARWTPRSAPRLNALRICSCAWMGPSDTTATSPAPAFSPSCRAASIAYMSKSFTSYFAPDSSIEARSPATRYRISMSMTRLMHTACFPLAPSPCERIHMKIVVAPRRALHASVAWAAATFARGPPRADNVGCLAVDAVRGVDDELVAIALVHSGGTHVDIELRYV